MPTLPAARHANLNFVTPDLAIGGDLDSHDLDRCADQLQELEALGITHVVDCRIEWDDAELLGLHLPDVQYLHHGMDDAGQRIPNSWFDDAIKWIDAAGRTPSS